MSVRRCARCGAFAVRGEDSPLIACYHFLTCGDHWLCLNCLSKALQTPEKKVEETETRMPTRSRNNPIDRLHFGIKVWDFNKQKLVSANLFDSVRVRRSVAQWVVKENKEDKSMMDMLLWCFGDVKGRTEYEFEVNGQKMDIYEMYVEPNSVYLYDLVTDNITAKDAQKWLVADAAEMKERKK